MKKLLKNSLIAIALTFSFCFISNVKAYFTYNGVTYDENKITELARTAFNNPSFEPKNYYVQCNYYRTANPSYVFECYFMEHPYTTMTKYSSTSYFNNYYVYGQTGNSQTTGALKYRYRFSYSLSSGGWFSINTSTGYANGFSSSWDGNIYTNFDYTRNGTLISSKLDFDPKPYTFNFHLNDGYLHNDEIDFSADEDFSVTLYKEEIDGFFKHLELNKSTMVFEGFYYDKNFTQPFNLLTDNLEEHVYLKNDDKFIDLYAKWRYEIVDDFLNDINFVEYEFDKNFDYAIINRGNNVNDVYLGLPFSTFSLEVYEYNESSDIVKDGASACPTPIYSKNGYHIYNINTLFTTNQEILILPRTYFDNLDPNSFEDPNDMYKFYLSDNAYISYTNDLSEADIVNSTGEHVNINLQNSYELSRQYQEIYSNDNIFSKVKIFLSKINKSTNAIKEIFQYLFNSLNETIQAFLIFITILILVASTIKFIRRG